MNCKIETNILHSCAPKDVIFNIQQFAEFVSFNKVFSIIFAFYQHCYLFVEMHSFFAGQWNWLLLVDNLDKKLAL